jgi:protocatechuate 3,4-dioxygenase, beta subunit
MKPILLMAFAFFLLQYNGCTQNKKPISSKGNSKHIGGSCEGCEAIYESKIPFEKLKPTDTLPDFKDDGPKLIVSGIVYQRDGKTPAKDVVVYIYHTDQTGQYTPGPAAEGWEKRHGSLRGWVKTGADGRYTFYTLKPASYPNTNIAAHIHATVKESGKNEYYIDEYLFDDDPKLTEKERKMQFRGGYGILKLTKGDDGILRGTRNIVLGLNVPDYH